MRLLVISGGRHPYQESTPVLEGFLKHAGHDVSVHWTTEILTADSIIESFDALIFNTLRVGETSFTSAEQAVIEGFISNGKGFICIHISGCAPESWPEYRDITGGGWDMTKSFHPPFGEFIVNIQGDNHPVVEGISDFVTLDELYMGIEYLKGNHVFMSATSEEGTYTWRGKATYMPRASFPLGWTRKYGDGKVFVVLLGHNGLSLQTPEFQKMVLNGVSWVTS